MFSISALSKLVSSLISNVLRPEFVLINFNECECRSNEVFLYDVNSAYLGSENETLLICTTCLFSGTIFYLWGICHLQLETFKLEDNCSIFWLGESVVSIVRRLFSLTYIFYYFCCFKTISVMVAHSCGAVEYAWYNYITFTTIQLLSLLVLWCVCSCIQTTML